MAGDGASHDEPANSSKPVGLHRQWLGLRANIGGWITAEASASDLLAGQHVLLGTLGGGGRQVLVHAEGAAPWRG